MNFLSPSSTLNAPPPVSTTTKKQQQQQPIAILASSSSSSVAAPPPPTFEFDTIPFLYDKKNKQWMELEDAAGKTRFAFERASSSITIQYGSGSHAALHHKISVTLQLQKQIAQSKCWVFRAVHCDTEVHDVLCLQLCENAASFVSQFERYRARCLAELEDAAAPTTTTTTPKTTSAAAKSLTTTAQHGRDLSPVGTIALDKTTTTMCSTSDGARFRRRLSTAGSDPKLDGHSPGSRYEPAAQASPSRLSPMRTSKAVQLVRDTAPAAMLFSGISVKGKAPSNPDKPNQDALLMHQLGGGEGGGELVFGVFDGHGTEGHEVSKYFRQRFPKLLASLRNTSSSSEQQVVDDECIRQALERTERELIDNCRVDTTLSGSTGVVVVVRGDELTVANVGDSRAVLAMSSSISGGFVAKDLTEDHKPDSPEEEKRILEVGGRVFAIKFDDGIDGPPRVWLSYADYPGLAMSRSLCDTIAKEAGVISRADVYHERVTKAEHKALIIASDGLWEFMTSQEVVDIVHKYSGDCGEGQQMTRSPDPEGAVQELVRESNKRWKMNEPVVDDTTIIVAFFV